MDQRVELGRQPIVTFKSALQSNRIWSDVVTIRPDKRRNVTDTYHLFPADFEDCVVRTDFGDHRIKGFANQSRDFSGGVAWVAVCVPDGNGGYPGRNFCPIPVMETNSLANGKTLDSRDARSESEDGPEIHDGLTRCVRSIARHAVYGAAWSYQIQFSRFL